ncbi:hypothetical protein [Nocardia brasiliensis]|uniref:hypothetical protein n=1 Tax=Nocardia brasiliensis TaxID=37326 RepID=UPI0004A70DD1|nr:hypothetical protein [Nocardia brasiliensis]
MTKPMTLAQRKVLRALQNQAVELAAMTDTANQRTAETGERLPRFWYEDYHSRATQREALEKAAYAGGVSKAWIDQVRERGSNGIGWRANLPMRPAEPLDLDRVLGDLVADVQLLQEWTVFDIAQRMRSRIPEQSVPGFLERNLRALRARTNGIANLLGLDAELGEQLWGTPADWAYPGAKWVMGLSVDRTPNPWNNAAEIDTRDYALQAVALGVAGIVVDTADAVASVESLAAAIDSLLPRVVRPFKDAIGGAEIASAVAAAESESAAIEVVETWTGSSLFSDSPEPGMWSYDADPDRKVPQPQFSEAEWLGR